MASIYDTIPTWSSSTTYSKYDIVLGSDSRYYYSLIDSNNGAGNNPTTQANLQVKWDGYINFNSNLVPNFFWKPSYQTTISSDPRIRMVQFGNGYQQRIPDGINTNLVMFDINFNNRKEKETVSLLHFLQTRNAQESFIYNLPIIYNKSKLNTRFISPTWSVDYNSYNNYSIKTKFQEVPV
jgi:phage-related protein